MTEFVFIPLTLSLSLSLSLCPSLASFDSRLISLFLDISTVRLQHILSYTIVIIVLCVEVGK